MDINIFWTEKYPDQKPIGLGNSSEAKAVERFFRGKRLQDVSLSSLRKEYHHDPSAALVFMTEDAFAFFLPAFMRIALEDYESADAIPEAVINRFLEMAEGRDMERRQAIIRRYSPEQIKAIADFLKNMSERYWHNYPEDTAKRATRYWAAPVR